MFERLFAAPSAPVFRSFCLPLFAFLLFPFALFAQQSGWDFIQNNDWLAAKPAFEAELRNTAGNDEALLGLLFLQETVQDQAGFQQSANSLLAAGWQPQIEPRVPIHIGVIGNVALFGQMFDGEAAEMARRELPENLRLAFIRGEADSLFDNRKFEASRLLLATAFHDWNWSITGPFTNVSGSGFVETTAVETAVFDSKSTFLNEEGREFGWLKRENRRPDGIVRFEDLPPTGTLATYYANTFLTVPTARKAQIRLARRSPMKVWLDGQLLVELPKSSSYHWDLERISIDLPAGPHRLLVKYSQFPQAGFDQKLALDFNDRRNDGDGDYDSYDDSFFQNSLGDSEFVLRLTDENGRIFNDVVSDFEGKIADGQPSFSPVFSAREWLVFYQKQAETGRLSALYQLSKMYLKYEEAEAGEAFFVKKLAENPESAFLKFLLAKFFHENGKGEKAESLLSELDTTACPTFAWQLKNLNEIDPAQREADYQTGLEKLLNLSPSNWPMVRRYLQFLKEKGRREVIEPFVKSVLAAHPKDEKWQKRLEDYLKDDSYRPESQKEQTDKEREKAFKLAQKRLKKRFEANDYSTVIEFLKQKDRDADVLSMFDDIQAAMPWATGWERDHAGFLFEKNRLDEALEICNRLAVWEPYSASLCELQGDIFLEKKDKTTALDFYKKAKKLGGQYDGYGLAEKIGRLETGKKYSPFFDKIDLAEVVKDRSWVADYADEESVISHFSTQIWLNEDATLEMTRRMVIEIQSAEGAKMWTEGDFQLMGSITSARVVKPNGSSSSPDLSGGMAVFKNLAPGDRIEMEGTNQQPMPDEIGGDFLWFDMLPFAVPVVSASLEMLVPRDTSLFFTANRLDPRPTIVDSAGFRKHCFSWKNLPKTEQNEDAAPENLDRFPWLMVGTAEDWSPIVKWYLRKTYARTEPNYEVLEKIGQLLQSEMDESEKVAAIYEFITRDVKYSFVPFLNSSYTPKRPAETISGAVGDCKDVATLMISMLREAGIPAWHVLVSTHNFSNREPRPTLYVFNHAITAWESADGKLHFIDLTTDYFPPTVMPEMDNAAWGLVIRPGETRLRRLPNDAMNPEKSRIDLKTTAIVGADRSISLDVESVSTGVAAGKFRETLNPKTEADRLKFLSEYLGGGSMSNLNFEKTAFENLENLSAPLVSRLKIRSFNQVDKVSNFHIIPLPFVLSMPAKKELFAPSRYNDLDLNDLFEIAPTRETVDLTLPDEFELLETPAPVWRQNEFGDYSLRFEKTKTGLKITRELTFKQRFIRHEDYAAFKSFYLDLTDADGTKLALRSKTKPATAAKTPPPVNKKSPIKAKAAKPLEIEMIRGKRT